MRESSHTLIISCICNRCENLFNQDFEVNNVFAKTKEEAYEMIKSGGFEKGDITCPDCGSMDIEVLEIE